MTTRLSPAARRIAREEAADRPDVHERIAATFREAESIGDPALVWRRLKRADRRSLIAYLVDDIEEWREHRRANLAALAMLLRAENGAKNPVTPIELRTLRRDTDNTIADVFDTIEALMGEVDTLKDERDEARKAVADIMSAVREAANDPTNDITTANRILDAAEGAEP